MGGIVVDPPTHATEVGGLYAAGECTAAGDQQPDFIPIELRLLTCLIIPGHRRPPLVQFELAGHEAGEGLHDRQRWLPHRPPVYARTAERAPHLPAAALPGDVQTLADRQVTGVSRAQDDLLAGPAVDERQVRRLELGEPGELGQEWPHQAFQPG